MNQHNLLRLQTSLLNNKWMIEPGAYHQLFETITKQSNGVALPPPMGNSADTDNSFVTESETDGPYTGCIHVCGILSKNPNPLEAIVANMIDVDYITHCLNEYAADDSIDNILLVFNSPGGETIGIEELGRLIVDIDTNIKPVYAWTEVQASSAAYWLASQCRSIGMTPTATVGSIGVYSLVLDETQKLINEGLKLDAIYSGKYKLIGHSWHTLSEEERNILQTDVVEQHEKFKNIVNSKRPNVDKSVMEGLSYEGNEAVGVHLADIVYDSMNDYLEYINNMKTQKIKVNSKKTGVASTPESELTFAQVAKKDLLGETPAAEKKETSILDLAKKQMAVPGVPGTEEKKTEKKKSGKYDGGYQEEVAEEEEESAEEKKTAKKKSGKYDGGYQEEVAEEEQDEPKKDNIPTGDEPQYVEEEESAEEEEANYEEESAEEESEEESEEEEYDTGTGKKMKRVPMGDKDDEEASEEDSEDERLRKEKQTEEEEEEKDDAEEGHPKSKKGKKALSVSHNDWLKACGMTNVQTNSNPFQNALNNFQKKF